MITRVQALYYKAFKFIDIHLQPFLLLVGPNASGKSSFLDIFTKAILLKMDYGK